MARVRGMAFLGAAHWIRGRYGEEVLRRIVDDAGPATQATFASRIDGLKLEEYESFTGLLHSADRHLGSGDLSYARTLGDLAARSDLQTIFRGYVVRPKPEDMIRACSPIWSMYTEGAGYMIAESVRPDDTVLRIYEFPDMDPAHCKLMEGWMIAAMDFVGARVMPGARERQCSSHGDPFHEFWCRWEMKF